MRIFQPILIVVACLLTACAGSKGTQLISKVPGLEGLSVEAIGLDGAQLVVIDQVDPTDRRAINVIRINQKASINLVEIARKGDRSTYMSASRRGVILNNGILTQTQGVGGDLAGAQHETLDLRITGRVFTKVHTTLGGDDRIHAETFRCIRTARAVDYFGLDAKRRLLQPIDEVCRNEDRVHENVYFLHPGTGTVFRSRQWVSDQLGYFRIEQIQLP
jgi:hypothetical protein